jgi:hypothetical protein
VTRQAVLPGYNQATMIVATASNWATKATAKKAEVSRLRIDGLLQSARQMCRCRRSCAVQHIYACVIKFHAQTSKLRLRETQSQP